MDNALIHLVFVTSGLVLLVVLPFVPVARLIYPRTEWPTLCLTAMVMGCSLQAVSGTLWGHLVGGNPHGELVLYGAVWLLLIILVYFSYNRFAADTPIYHEPVESSGGHTLLILILAAAFAVRVIHPLQVAYLGQSDAYTHLNYIHNIVDKGYLINPVYPPGYHWLLALPSLVFTIDPYLVARYGGAFFGVGMVLAVYVLLDKLFDRKAAVFGSFCCGCFPLMNLLLKTGVGVFANQFGIFLVPVIVYFYVTIISEQRNGFITLILPALAMAGMAVSVPMMMLHLLVGMALERSVSLFRGPGKWLLTSLRVALICIPAFFLLVFHLSQVGAGHRFETANIMIGEGEKKQAVTAKMVDKVQKAAAAYEKTELDKLSTILTSSPYFHLLIDYVSIKRVNGFSNKYLNTLALILAGFFLLFFIYGLVKNHTGFLIVGLWGGLTVVMAGTGLFQFSSYQREGWSLLIAVCCLSGVIASTIYDYFEEFTLFKIAVSLTMLLSLGWTLKHPPVHFQIHSGSEGEIVDLVRFLGKKPQERMEFCRSSYIAACQIDQLLNPEIPVTIVSRRFLGWGNQGEITKNVLQNYSDADVILVRDRGKKDLGLKAGKQYVVIVDEKRHLPASHITSTFAMVTPGMVEQTLGSRKKLMRANKRLLGYIDDLSEDGFRVERLKLSESLKAIVVTPL